MWENVFWDVWGGVQILKLRLQMFLRHELTIFGRFFFLDFQYEHWC